MLTRELDGRWRGVDLCERRQLLSTEMPLAPPQGQHSVKHLLQGCNLVDCLGQQRGGILWVRGQGGVAAAHVLEPFLVIKNGLR